MPDKSTPFTPSVKVWSASWAAQVQVPGTLGPVPTATPSTEKVNVCAPSQSVEFTKNRRGDFAQLYGKLARATESDFEKFVDITQKVAIDLAVESMFEMLVQAGMIEDKRDG